MTQDFLYLLEITRFVHDVLQLEKLFLAVLMNEQRLRLGGGCAVVVLCVKSLFARQNFRAVIATVKPIFLTAGSIGAYAFLGQRAVGATVKIRPTAAAPLP